MVPGSTQSAELQGQTAGELQGHNRAREDSYQKAGGCMIIAGIAAAGLRDRQEALAYQVRGVADRTSRRTKGTYSMLVAQFQCAFTHARYHTPPA